ncbi:MULTISPECIES: hypothetical protein [unclassified Actinotalea]|uniref:hypothetical protein n=1 Tax=unclassified Actinotalea TaxID=2638618 RepID=UPI0015F6941F|nr:MULTISPECIES: hypothetical protein [unclassified Actinotalea]
MIIDCGTCTVRGDACTDCVVTFLTIPVRAGAAVPDQAAQDAWSARAAPEAAAGVGAPDLDDAERAALAVLARSGLVPPLRLVRAV